jgi:hypothetical protein
MQHNRPGAWNVSLQALRACSLSPRVHACAVSCQNSVTSFATVTSCCACFRESDILSLQLRAAPSDDFASERTSLGSFVLNVKLVGLCCRCNVPCSFGSCPSISELTIGSLPVRIRDCFAGVPESVLAQVADAQAVGEVTFQVAASPALPRFYSMTSAAAAGAACMDDAYVYLDSSALMIQALDCVLQRQGAADHWYRTACMGVFASVEILLVTLKRQRHICSAMVGHFKRQKVSTSVLHRMLFQWFSRASMKSRLHWRLSLFASRCNRLRRLVAFGRWASAIWNYHRHQQSVIHFNRLKAGRAVLKNSVIMWRHSSRMRSALREASRNSKLKALLFLEMNMQRQNYAQMQMMFQRWTYFASDSKSNRTLSALKVLNSIQKEAHKDTQIHTRCTKLNLKLHICHFGYWVTYVHEVRRLRGVSAKAVRRLSKLALSRAFSSWLAHVIQLMQQRETMTRAIQRAVRPAVMFCAFSGWSTVCIELAESRKQEQEVAFSLSRAVESESHKASRNELIVDRRAKQCAFRLKSIGVAIWMKRVHEVRRLRGVSAKAVRRLSKLALSRAFSSWLAHVIQLMQQRNAVASDAILLQKKAAQHLKIATHLASYVHKSLLRFCIGHWISRNLIIKRTRVFIKQLTLRRFFSAFEWWREYLYFMTWLRSVKVLFFNRVVALRHVFRVFSCWSVQVSGQKFLRSVMMLRSSLIHKSNKFLRIAWRRSLSGFVLFCFATWRSLFQTRKRFEQFCSLANQRSAHYVASTSFRAWRSALGQSRASEQLADFRSSQVEINTQVFKKYSI